ncbi:MAG: cupredoxin domain-containing protein [Actinomycetota bacterium]|nr:cupredoxin domain-containing protein [Actinomycetota bacterium]
MTRLSGRRLRVPAALLAITAGAVACSSGSGSGPETAITATDSECRVGKTNLTTGKNTFVVVNKGDKVTEVYIYGAGDKVVTEKENIGPGTTVRVTASLPAGVYEVACKPGQRGSGIRQSITVADAATSTTR